MAHYLDGHPIVYRAYYRPSIDRWRGYAGSDVPGTSYGLCRPDRGRHSHRTEIAAITCARRTAPQYKTRESLNVCEWSGD